MTALTALVRLGLLAVWVGFAVLLTSALGIRLRAAARRRARTRLLRCQVRTSFYAPEVRLCGHTAYRASSTAGDQPGRRRR